MLTIFHPSTPGMTFSLLLYSVPSSSDSSHFIPFFLLGSFQLGLAMCDEEGSPFPVPSMLWDS